VQPYGGKPGHGDRPKPHSSWDRPSSADYSRPENLREPEYGKQGVHRSTYAHTHAHTHTLTHTHALALYLHPDGGKNLWAVPSLAEEALKAEKVFVSFHSVSTVQPIHREIETDPDHDGTVGNRWSE
jgi:hypothetical protein